MANKTGKGGFTTTYTPDIIDKLIEHFEGEPTSEQVVTVQARNGAHWEQKVEMGNNLPTVEGFCWKYRIPRSTFYDWCNAYPELSDTLRMCQLNQHEHLVQNGMRGHYNPGLTQFLLKNIHGDTYKDKSEIEHGGSIGTKLTPEAKAGINKALNGNKNKS